MNRTAKSKPTPSVAYEVENTQPSRGRPSATPSLVEVEKNQEDVASLNNDLQLLSTLLGRPISGKDLPQLTQKATPQRKPSTAAPTTARQPPTKGASDLYLPSADASDGYGKTNDAILATILKQRGIGPAHNNIPVDLFSTTTTTQRPRPPFPVRSSRPLLDGLSWLWRTWQDTAPGTETMTRTRTRGLPSNELAPQHAPSPLDDGLDSDTSSVSYLFALAVCS